jgi:hypothetical protein
LQAESRILHGNDRMTAPEESRETKRNRMKVSMSLDFLNYMVMRVKPLLANRILANHGF